MLIDGVLICPIKYARVRLIVTGPAGRDLYRRLGREQIIMKASDPRDSGRIVYRPLLGYWDDEIYSSSSFLTSGGTSKCEHATRLL